MSTFRTEKESSAVSMTQIQQGQHMFMNEYPSILQAEVGPYEKRYQPLIR